MDPHVRGDHTKLSVKRGHTHGRAAFVFASKSSMALALTMVSPISSRPLSRQCLRWASISNFTTPPSGPRISCFSRSTVSVALAPRSASSNSLLAGGGFLVGYFVVRGTTELWRRRRRLRAQPHSPASR